MAEYDVIVVGGGNAAFCAALAAQEQGAKVVVLEAAPEDEAGGNSRFTAGSIRVVYNGVDDIKTLIPDLTPKEIEETDFGLYEKNLCCSGSVALLFGYFCPGTCRMGAS